MNHANHSWAWEHWTGSSSNIPRKKDFLKRNIFIWSFGRQRRLFSPSTTLVNEEEVGRKTCTPDGEAKLILVTQYLYLFKKNWTPLNVTLLYFPYHSDLRRSPGHKHQNHFDYYMLQIQFSYRLINRAWKIPSHTCLGQIGNFPRQEPSICAESKLSLKNKMFLVS